ncbi:unnamed protein product [Candida verbasci]|uniref:SURF1-like protein n=1 Tax=Candida verbasci TaxID=1227364 RepID=A0A9W4TUL6_9ASCO|nr:unnamed protein product [Candida verbasci]
MFASILGASRHIYKKNLLQCNRFYKTITMDWKPMKAVPGALRTLDAQAKVPTIRKVILGLMYGMPIISFFLGCWQVRRLQWKTNLISKCENNLAAPIIPELPKNLDPNVIPEFEYRRFKVKGHFNYDQEIFLGPRLKDGVVGYLVVTPFIRSNGGKPILIERGWIHKDKVIPETRSKGYLSHLALPKGEIDIEALFRIMPKKSYLQIDHEDGSRLFNIPDVEAMAKQSNSLPIYCQMIYDLHDHKEYRKEEKKNENGSILSKLFFKKQSSEGGVNLSDLGDSDSTLQYQEFEFVNEGVPLAAKPYIKFTNNHLQYLITWFGVSICSTIALVYSSWKSRQFSSVDKIIASRRKEMKKIH